MSIIRVLPENVSNQIAAGEVIERPASVVKELIENALDAGATRVRVLIEKAGTRLIHVSDNGRGMDPDDALLCFEPHGTSKIHDVNDLRAIASYGFRGEAIPSIASIARVTLKTRNADFDNGTQVSIAGGKMGAVAPTGLPVGTDFQIRDLFFNVPARLKFLKSDATEERHIYDCVMNMALPNPKVAFELFFDNRNVIHSPASESLLPRLQFFFGKSFAHEMLAVDYHGDGLAVSGWIARHGVTRHTRAGQRFFVNGRAIESYATFQGVKEGYGSLVEKGCYPPCVLFISCDPASLDVNVHPAKREIRFRKEYDVIRCLSDGIRNTLQTIDSPAVAVNTNVSLRTLMNVGTLNVRPAVEKQAAPMPHFEVSNDASPHVPFPPDAPAQAFTHLPDVSPEVASTTPGMTESLPEMSASAPMVPSLALDVLGILSDTYILAKFEDGLVVIDQHAAHERVLFERIMARALAKDLPPVQKLLFPVPIELSRMESVLMKRYIPFFERVGFDVAEIGTHSVMLSGIPENLKQDAVDAQFHALLELLMEDDSRMGRNAPSIDTLARAACKAAVKAHDKLSLPEVQSLIQQMGECQHPFSCPHGRPTLIHISLKELEKRFSRA